MDELQTDEEAVTLQKWHSPALDAEHRKCHHPVHGWSCVRSEVRAKPSLKLALRESTFMARARGKENQYSPTALCAPRANAHSSQ